MILVFHLRLLLRGGGSRSLLLLGGGVVSLRLGYGDVLYLEREVSGNIEGLL